jgi:hypothetical protein
MIWAGRAVCMKKQKFSNIVVEIFYARNHLAEIYRVITKEMTEIKYVLLSHGVT